MDYSNWILSESNGSVKLNKVVRRIFATYIPFRADICNNLMSNNTFTEHIQLYDLKKKQQFFLKEEMQTITAKSLLQMPVPY